MPSNPTPSPSGGDGTPKMTLWERLRYAMVRPDDEPSATPPPDERTVEELEAAIRRSDDKERAIGLVAAPLAAVVALLISDALVSNARTHQQSVTAYQELTYVMLGLSVLILVSSIMRRRLFQGITLALFGVAVFQLHFTYVGFAAPFVLAGAWYLVRAYRLQQALRRAEVDESSGRPRKGGAPSNGARPRQNKRYTPPS
jgi:hypothetical protein